MIRYILKRFLLVIPVLLGATLLVFTIMEFTPGDPAKLILGNEATEEDITNLREEMGLNDPFVVRYVRFVTNMLKGDLGISYRNKPGCFGSDNPKIKKYNDSGRRGCADRGGDRHPSRNHISH